MKSEMEKYREQMMEEKWIKFREQLSKNPSRKDILSFINDNEWTDRQKKTIMKHMNSIDSLLTRDLKDENDLQRLNDDKAIVDCDLMSGMTNFDVTPEFNILIDFINIQFGIESRQARFKFKR